MTRPPARPLDGLFRRCFRIGPTVAAALLSASIVGCEPAAPSYDLVLRGGQVIDGTGAPARTADVAIEGDAIAAIGDLGGADAERVIDASGLIVAPGFIDMHSHSDFTLLVDGRALSKTTQGVTTEVLGESGSAGPVLGAARDEMAGDLERYGLELTWSGLGEYFDTLERKGTSVNVVSTVGAGLVRASVMGYEDRPPTAREMERMRELVDTAMREGAIGLSSGMVYAPNSYFTTEEMIELAEPAAQHGGIYLTHIRDEDDDLLDALEEAITIGREAGLPLEILHFKRSAVRPEGPRLEPSIRDAVAMIERHRDAGTEVAANLYPYSASQTGLDIRLPEWIHDGGRERMVERLRNPETRARAKEALREMFRQGRGGKTPETIMLGATPYEPHRQYQGMRLSEISRQMEIDPAETLVELVEKGDGRVHAIYFSMREEDVRYLLGLPWTTVGSDGTGVAPEGVFLESHPHPRWYGSFPRVLGKYVREEGVLSLPEAVRKMTSLAAERIGLEDRGRVAEGMKADLVIFDHETIRDQASFANPHQLSQGVEWLIVNGGVVIAEGEHTGAKPGRVVKGRGGA